MSGVIRYDAGMSHLLLLGRQPPNLRRGSEEEKARRPGEDGQATKVLDMTH